MKRLLSASFAAAAASALALGSCSEPENAVIGTENRTIVVEVTALAPQHSPDDTRITIKKSGDNLYSAVWDQNESFIISEFVDGKLQEPNKSVETEGLTSAETDGTSAFFSFRLAENLSGNKYDYYAVYPAGSGEFDTRSAGYDEAYVKFTMPAQQVQPNADSADSDAVLMFAESTGHTVQATSLELQFGYAASFGHLKIRNLELAAGETVKEVRFTAPDKALAGPFEYHWSAEQKLRTYDKMSDAVAVDVSAAVKGGSKAFDVWFGVLPADDIDIFEVCITTEHNGGESEYKKSVRIADGKKLSFKSGRISAFGVDMTGISSGDDSPGDEKDPDQPELPEGAIAFTIGSDGSLTLPDNMPKGAKAVYQQENGTNGTLPKGEAGTLTLDGFDSIKEVYIDMFAEKADADVQIILMKDGDIFSAKNIKTTVTKDTFCRFKAEAPKDMNIINIKNTSSGTLHLQGFAIITE